MQITMILDDIINQLSTKDAGNFTVATYMKIGDDFYELDTITVENLYKTKALALESLKPIEVTDSVTWGGQSEYELFFSNFAHNVPTNSYIMVIVPEPLNITN
jgi:hypothetical protein